jgi:hypothetical protein
MLLPSSQFPTTGAEAEKRDSISEDLGRILCI